MSRLIECVPNFSEGHDRAKIDALVSAMSGVANARVLDWHADADHNRCVITVAGAPEGVAEAALLGVGKARDVIDLRRHSGAHPRIGATDVLPFVPIDGVTLQDCIDVAHRVGREIWSRHQIPVYFYAAAAIRPERADLANVRRGEFEQLREDVFHDAKRLPDIGHAKLHPTAGAVAVGARMYLIAYNINLKTNDVSIAKTIARKIRFSNGGLPCVKAIGIPLKARAMAQVSINLTDFEQTPIHVVFERVRREAAAHGCVIGGSEIVGLVPAKALEMAAGFDLQLEQFSPAQVLENRLASALAAKAPHGI